MKEATQHVHAVNSGFTGMFEAVYSPMDMNISNLPQMHLLWEKNYMKTMETSTIESIEYAFTYTYTKWKITYQTQN